MKFPETENKDWDDSGQSSRSIVRLVKGIVRGKQGKQIDSNVVSSEFYNCFNYSMLAKINEDVHFAVGIVSARAGEGRTLVAANLAVSLATANQRETVLVDLSFQSPSLHRIFGGNPEPGLAQALSETNINVFPTAVELLDVLPAGDFTRNMALTNALLHMEGAKPRKAEDVTFGIEQIAGFRDVLYSLKQSYQFIVVDMPPLHDTAFPVLLTQQMDAILVVIDVHKTRHEDIEHVLHRIGSDRVTGFVLNRVTEKL